MWAKCEREGREPPSRTELPEWVDLPLDTWNINGHVGFKASVLFPISVHGESVGYMRKRIRMDRLAVSGGVKAINLVSGEYMSKNIPIPKLLVGKMVAYCVGITDDVRDLLSDVRYIGRYTSGGLGKVAGLSVDAINDDFSCVMDGRAMRHLPMATGYRRCRVVPPYWNNYDQINVCEIGDDYVLQTI
jgi:CRISPR type IV-associated protein Csf3